MVAKQTRLQAAIEGKAALQAAKAVRQLWRDIWVECGGDGAAYGDALVVAGFSAEDRGRMAMFPISAADEIARRVTSELSR